MAHPIWSDYFVTYEGDRCDFTIEHDGGIIYEGSAVRRPNEDYISIKINDICANYVKAQGVIDVVNAEDYETLYVYTFKVSILVGGEIYKEEDVELCYDYSFDYYAETFGFTPIGNKVGKFITASVIQTVLQIRTFDEDGEILSEWSVEPVKSSNILTLTRWLDDAARVEVEYYEWDKKWVFDVDRCAQYSLVFLNEFGGVNTLLIEGKTMQEDSYARSTFGTSASNDGYGSRQIAVASNDITRKWTLHTGWLDDKSAANMHHLLSSPDVLLADINLGEYYAVNILNNTCEYKTYANNGNHLVRYDIEVEFAQKMIRR